MAFLSSWILSFIIIESLISLKIIKIKSFSYKMENSSENLIEPQNALNLQNMDSNEN